MKDQRFDKSRALQRVFVVALTNYVADLTIPSFNMGRPHVSSQTRARRHQGRDE